METKKVLSLIFSILFIGAFAFVLSWGIINFNKVQDGISGTGVYTKEDVDNAYKDGYSTALDNEKEYTQLIDSYRDTITTQTDELSKLNNQLLTLTNSNKDYTNQIANLTEQKNSLEEQVNNLSLIKNSNESTINDLTSQILILEKEVSDLQNSDYNKSQEIAQKNSQISNLQNSVNQLQKTNELNVQTINSLNNQITTLNSQISEMTLQIQNNSTNVTTLNNKIAELEKSVAYYEQYLASLENGEQVVATFEFNGSVYNIQIVSANSTLSVTTPNSTDYIVFNYWTVNGEQIDLSTYTINQNTKIVADVTYNYDVKFMVDDSVYNNQIITKNGFATLPINPTKSGYEFDGWTINGVDIIDPTSVEIIDKTTFVAKFTKLHNVNFVYEDSTISTQSIRNGNFANNVSVDNTTYKKFNGWTINGTIVDLDSYKIVAETTFIADIIYSYDVTFIVDDEVYNSQIVQNNNYVVLPTEMPQKNRYEFVGWSLDGVNVVDVENMPITSNMSFICVWIERIGFDGDYFKIENFPVQFDDKWEADEYFGYFANGYIYVINKSTFELNYYNINAVPSINHKESYFVYNNDIYFIRNGYNHFIKFDLESRTAETLVIDKNFSSCTFALYNDIVLVVGKTSSSEVGYYTYNVNTGNQSDVSMIGNNIVNIDFKNSCIVNDKYLYAKLNVKRTTSVTNDYLYVFNIETASYEEIFEIPCKVTSSSIKSCVMYESFDGIYLTFTGTIAKYDYATRSLSSFVEGSYTSYNLVIDDLAYLFDGSNKRIICRNLVTGDEVYFDYPYAEGSTCTAYEFIKIDDNKYIIRFNTTYNGVCFVYFYV